MRTVPAVLAMVLLTTAMTGLPASADDVEESIEAALDAYRAGDIDTAKDELDFAAELLGQIKAEALGAYLPAPLPGWERQETEQDARGMAAFGGGQMAAATYTRDDRTVEVRLMADNAMVSAMAGMLSSPALMGAMGQIQWIGGNRAVLTPEGDLQALIDERILVQIGGTADSAAKTAYFEALDTDALKEF